LYRTKAKEYEEKQEMLYNFIIVSLLANYIILNRKKLKEKTQKLESDLPDDSELSIKPQKGIFTKNFA
jgi:hypothetical protein